MRKGVGLVPLLALSLVACAPSTPPSPSAVRASATTGAPSSAASASSAGLTGCTDQAEDVGDLTGVWDVDDGGRYFLRQMGDCVWWFGTSLAEIGEDGEQPGFANVALGRVVGDRLLFEWADVPLGDILGGGTLTLRIDPSGDRLEKLRETGTGFGGVMWTRHERASGASRSTDPNGPTSLVAGTPRRSATPRRTSLPASGLVGQP